jgi:Fe-S-cluster containining protein
MGFDGNHGGCCTLGNRDFIIGPHFDTKEFIQRLSTKFGREIKHEEVFIDYEEGKKLFPSKSMWSDEKSYPSLRVDTMNPFLPCIFYNMKLKACMVYEIRPDTCKNFECTYLSEQTKGDFQSL